MSRRDRRLSRGGTLLSDEPNTMGPFLRITFSTFVAASETVTPTPSGGDGGGGCFVDTVSAGTVKGFGGTALIGIAILAVGLCPGCQWEGVMEKRSPYSVCFCVIGGDSGDWTSPPWTDE